MFKFFERAIRAKKLANTPRPVKINAITNIVANIIRQKPNELMPVISRIGVVMNYIQQKNLVDFYFMNRKLLPSLCADLNCL